jgi:hypothetical protein
MGATKKTVACPLNFLGDFLVLGLQVQPSPRLVPENQILLVFFINAGARAIGADREPERRCN